MKSRILLPIAIIICAFCLQFCNQSKDNDKATEMESPMVVGSDTIIDNMPMDHGMMQTMTMSMDKMKSLEMTGDFDLDFATMMVMHHQSAIRIAEIEIAKGMDLEAKTMAQNMITAQKSEIDQFQSIINNHKSESRKEHSETNKDHSNTGTRHGESHDELRESNHKMMDKMKALKMTGNTDKDFVLMMIPHHEGAIAMAEAEMSHGDHLDLKKMALRIITDQKKEIDELRGWLAQH